MTQIPPKKDYYRLLRVHPQASMSEIKKAYRQLALQFHPDKNPGDIAFSQALFAEINEAYRVLSNIVSRKNYDASNYNNSSFLLFRNFDEWKAQIDTIRKYVMSADPFRLQRDELYYIMETILDKPYTFWIQEQEAIHDRPCILSQLLDISKYLTHKQLTEINYRLQMIFQQPVEVMRINNHLAEMKRAAIWQRFSWIFAIFLTMLFCFIIIIFTR
jgi:hypothetical protein